MELRIKNMVCGRCLKLVGQLFTSRGYNVLSAELGKVTIAEGLTREQLDELRAALLEEGFDLLDDQKSRLVEEIRNLIIEKIHYGRLDEMREKFSSYLSARLHKDYNYLSNLFSSIENTTIEQFIILQKIEKIKELLVYDEMPVSDIAFHLGYSSQAHLASQFKKITGFTPLQFKKAKDHHRKEIDRV